MLLTGTKGRLADRLFELEAVKFGAFRLKLHQEHPDAPLSPIYLNLRTDRHPKNPGPLTDEVMGLVGELFGEMIEGIFFDCYADIPEAGAPFGDEVRDAVANRVPQPRRLFLHKDGDKRRITEQVDGEFTSGDQVLVVDELITHADSKLEAIRALEGAGLIVQYVLVLVDRAQGGAGQLAAAGYALLAALTLPELLDHYVARGFITQEKAAEVKAYLAAN